MKSNLAQVTATATLLFSTTGGQKLVLPPPMPAEFPSLDQSLFITGNLLTGPLVADALAYVNSVVDPKYLNLKKSDYIQWSTVTYNEDPVKSCYWPNALCTRNVDTADFKADVVKCPKANDWGLTFDDGPSVTGNGDDTPALRKALKSAGNIEATFFVTGSSVGRAPQELINVFNDGHQIAAHTWTHHPLTSLTNAQIVAEFKYTEALIYKTIGIVVKHFRPPYGDIDDRVRAIASSLGYKAIMWTTEPPRDSGDSSGVSGETASNNLLRNIKNNWFVAQPGFISLQHDITPFTTSLAVKVMSEIQTIGLQNLPVKPKTIASCIADIDWFHRFTSPIPTITIIATKATTQVVPTITDTTSKVLVAITATKATTQAVPTITGTTSKVLVAGNTCQSLQAKKFPNFIKLNPSICVTPKTFIPAGTNVCTKGTVPFSCTTKKILRFTHTCGSLEAKNFPNFIQLNPIICTSSSSVVKAGTQVCIHGNLPPHRRVRRSDEEFEEDVVAQLHEEL